VDRQEGDDDRGRAQAAMVGPLESTVLRVCEGSECVFVRRVCEYTAYHHTSPEGSTVRTARVLHTYSVAGVVWQKAGADACAGGLSRQTLISMPVDILFQKGQALSPPGCWPIWRPNAGDSMCIRPFSPIPFRAYILVVHALHDYSGFRGQIAGRFEWRNEVACNGKRDTRRWCKRSMFTCHCTVRWRGVCVQ
jgi:hypothetical protein